MRVTLVTPETEFALESSEGESAELLKWQLVSLCELDPERCDLVAEGHGPLPDAAPIGTTPILDGSTLAVVFRDGAPFARGADVGADAGGDLVPASELAAALQEGPQRLESMKIEAVMQEPHMMEGIQRMASSAGRNIMCDPAPGPARRHDLTPALAPPQGHVAL